MVNRSTETGLHPHPETLLEAYLLIMTPDTASSSAAMRAEVPTDRPRARWERDGWGGSRVTSTRHSSHLLTFPVEYLHPLCHSDPQLN